MENTKILNDLSIPVQAEYTVAEISEFLGLNKRYVQRLIHNGKLLGIKRGKSFFVSQDNLTAYLTNQQQTIQMTADDYIAQINRLLRQNGMDKTAFYKRILAQLQADPDTFRHKR